METILWKICMDDLMETILWKISMDNLMENNTLDQIDGNYTLENYMEKGGSIGQIRCF